MKYWLLAGIICFLLMKETIAQTDDYRKIDTTMKLGKSGYRIRCSNKNPEKNEIAIFPVGFENTARDMNFMINGRVKNAFIDDLNNDGFPDLVLVYFGGYNGKIGFVLGLVSEQNQRCIPVMFPDLRDDAKLRLNYGGNDTFWLLEGALFRKFPLIDSLGNSTMQQRTIQYRMINNTNGGFKFLPIRNFESKMQ